MAASSGSWEFGRGKVALSWEKDVAEGSFLYHVLDLHIDSYLST